MVGPGLRQRDVSGQPEHPVGKEEKDINAQSKKARVKRRGTVAGCSRKIIGEGGRSRVDSPDEIDDDCAANPQAKRRVK